MSIGSSLNGNSLVSCECGALFSAAYRSTAGGPPSRSPSIRGTDQGLLAMMYRIYAGGVTRTVWHSLPLSDNPGSTWPGPTAFPSRLGIAENFGTRNPNWADQGQLNAMLARCQNVLRQGQARFDVGVFQGNLGMDGAGNGPELTNDTAMSRIGYTYTYLNADALRRPEAIVRNGRPFPDTLQSKAFVVARQDMPVATAARVADMAKQRLPVVVVGQAPNRTPGAYNTAAEDAAVQASIARLTALAGNPAYKVAIVGSEADVPAALAAFGVTPAAAKVTPSLRLETVRRETADSNYYFVYNRVDTPVDEELRLTGTGIPYRLDATTGRIAPIAAYTREGSTVTLRVRLEADDAALYTLSARALDGAPQPRLALASLSGGDTVYSGRNIVVRSTVNGEVRGRLSTGKSFVARIAGALPEQPLNTWSLTVDGWSRGPNVTDPLHTSYGPLTVSADAQGMLPPWTAIAALRTVSGIGTYTTTVTLPDDWAPKGQGAYLSLGKATDMARLWINGQSAGALNPNDMSRIDVSRFLHGAANTIKVVVSSTLFNAANPTSANPQKYGLFGAVRLTSYGEATARR
jgi:hypothetical protein